MATDQKNLSDFNKSELPNAEKMRFGIVVSEWNNEITGQLLNGAYKTLRELNVSEENIIVHHVPGAFELALGAQYLLESTDVDT